MHKISDLSTAVVIILILIFLTQIWFLLDYSDENEALADLDHNKDGAVSREELKNYLLHIQQSKEKKTIKIGELLKSMYSGAIRGMLMGFVIADWEGGLTLAIISGILNPVITSTEKIF